MKKTLFFLLLAGLLLLPALPALAEEAPDITEQCTLKYTPTKYKINRIYDRKYRTTYESDKARSPYMEITAPKDQKIYGLYICFASQKILPWKVEAISGGSWVTVKESSEAYAHVYVPLDGVSAAKISLTSDKSASLVINELFVFGPGDVPSFVQQWQPAPQKADLLVLAAHPDDEILFFGGTIPYYAAERGMNVVVAYMTCNYVERRSELLNGLWEMGLRTYPDIGTLDDVYSKKLDTGYDKWGKTKTYQRIVELYRRYKPEVVVTHDVNGEYGHGAHRVCADAALHCVVTAADASKFEDTAVAYGVWSVKKVYLHLYGENALEMDWDQPLSTFGGKTGFEVAEAGYSWHVSQHDKGQENPETKKFELFRVEPRDSKYSCYRFGLAYTAVGFDTAKNDFFENIP